jgi:PAS domain S-box-containing protein
MPYRTSDNVIEGLVITFIDISAQQNAEDALAKSLVFEGIVQTVREPIMVLDWELRVMAVNRSFCNTFGIAPGQAEGSLVYELGNRQWDIPALRRLLEKILPENTQFNDFEVVNEFQGVGKKKMLLNARRIYQTGEGAGMILLAMEDVTAKEKEA